MSIRRPELTNAENRQIVPRKVVELVDAVNELERTAGDASELAALEARVDTLEGDVSDLQDAISTAGSIFSMTGPAGATAPVVAYDFTLFDESLTASQNLVNANRSGNSAFDLTGAAQIRYQSFTTVSSQTPYGWTPFSCRVDGGALTGSTGGTDYATTSGSPAALQLLGALSVEWLGYITATPTGDYILFDFSGDTSGGASETEANNILYRLIYVIADKQWEYFHESGAGTDSAVAWFVDQAGAAAIAGDKHNPLMFTLTRNGTTGVVTLYINGRKVGTPDDGSTGDFPTGGTTGNLRIGVGGTNGVPLTLGFRLFNVELTAAQVQASYRKTFFGVSA